MCIRDSFSTALLRKDLQLFLKEAPPLGVETQGLQGLADLLARAEHSSLDSCDYSALHELTEL